MKLNIRALIGVVLSLMVSTLAEAGQMELSGSFSFQQTNYGSSSNTQWSRRWNASAGYVFWDGYEEIEISVTDAFYRTQISGFEDTSYHDQIYSLNFVQGFTSRNSYVQPFVKVGIGQLNRDASGSVSGGSSPPAQYDALTAVLGAGLKVYLSRRVGLKAEGTTYLSGALLSTWKDNFAFSFGVSLYL
ncbi:MAG: hypothetical protein HYX41_06595 [Bdellovibrio sp.]|nr:hypothetical protein [Bdellovibrio sp.]